MVKDFGNPAMDAIREQRRLQKEELLQKKKVIEAVLDDILGEGGWFINLETEKIDYKKGDLELNQKEIDSLPELGRQLAEIERGLIALESVEM